MLVAWHDTECGDYTADLALWRELARRAGGRILDVGAGTGRVALDLARAGHRVTALDREAVLLEALRARAAAAELDVETVVADAVGFALPGRAFDAILVPMQTIQLLPGTAARGGFLAAARAHVAPGGLVAMAIATDLEPFDGALLPPPDVLERDGRRYESQPTAVRRVPGGVRIERLRSVDGAQPERDALVLAAVTPAQLEDEGRRAGLSPAPGRRVAATHDHVGSSVVILRG